MRISEFYNDKVLLVTGGSGFMGKVLLAKILRSCPSIRRIYVLLRAKKGQTSHERFQKLLKSEVFECLEKCPGQLEKLSLVMADLMEPYLGISNDDRLRLESEVNIIFHTAATVKFDEELHVSLSMNLRGTNSLLTLAKCMKKLEVFVHISTAYSNCDRSNIGEQVYPLETDPDKILVAAECLGSHLLEDISPRLLGNHPNTYTFTKALAEQLVYNHRHSIPVVIVRPSIVCCANREPYSGWVDNFNGPTGLMVGIGKGFTRTILARGELVADLVPVDMTINLVISAAWYQCVYGAGNSDKDQLPVYNFVTGQSNPIRWGKFERLWLDELKRNPLSNNCGEPGSCFISSPMVNKLRTVIYHTIPALALDLCLLLCGRSPFMHRVQRRMSKTAQCLAFFTTNQWTFEADRMNVLHEKMSEEDRETFDFDLSRIDWRRYVTAYREGIKHLLVKQKDAKNNLPEVFLTCLNRLSSIALLLLVLWPLLTRRSQLMRVITAIGNLFSAFFLLLFR